MAFIWKSPRSKFWQAGFLDKDGKRRNRSTSIIALEKNRKKADRIADEYEAVAQRKKSANHVKATLNDLLKEVNLTLNNEDALPIATVREYCDRFLEKKQGEVGKATIKRYKTSASHFCEWLGANAEEDISAITTHHLVRMRNNWRESISERTTYNKLKDVKAIFASALVEGFILFNPMDAMKLTKGTENSLQRRIFKIEELKSVLKECNDEWRSMVTFGLYTGQRLGDLATLKWSNLDLVRNEMQIVTRKTGKVITIPFSEPLADHLLTLDAPDTPQAYVHPSIAGSYETKNAGTLSNQFADILSQAGLREPVSHKSKGKGRSARRDETTLSFHSLRATAVTLMHEAGIPAKVVEEWVGHDSAEVHKAYVKIGREALKTASNALPRL